MEKYSLVLRNDKVKQYNRFAIFIILLNVVVFLAVSYYSPEKYTRNIGLFGVIAITVTLLIQYFFTGTKKRKESIFYSAALVLAFLTWVLIGYVWASIITIFLVLLYIIARNQVTIHFDNDNVVYSTIPQKIINWNQLNNVMLKDGLLTIDFRSNKIMQAEILDIDGNIDEKDFNEFCSQRLNDAAIPA